MDIPQLRTILHVAELGSLSKASERLKIAQPALSRQVRLLEAELGVRLFDRHGRGMVATESGRDVLRHARRIMAELDEIRACVSGEDVPLRGHVAVGMPPTVSDLLSVRLVAAFQERHPEATLRIVSAYSASLIDWLQRGEINVAIVYGTRPGPSLVATPLIEETLSLIGPPDAPPRDAPVDVDEISAMRLFLPSVGNGLRTVVEQWAEATGASLDVRVEADSYATLKSLVESGRGYTILPIAPLFGDIAAGRLWHAPFAEPAPRRRLLLVTPADRTTSRLARYAVRTIQETTRALARDGIWHGRVLTPEP
ncbi:LysR family transcriptional regulator [Acuticoccus sediminis]|uniref:LysR family transcriptional regulator n=1 Tax=Acuticoccus sediminis TaxID=2184697 RepID=UPI001CFDB963|nr:LysR substrate-binding domain-containing protein [Acuticoccus sediminis]